MFSLAKIDKLQDKLRKLEEQIEKEKEEAHKGLGEELVKRLDLDYELLSTKKEIKSVVGLIVSELNSNPFSNDIEKNETDISSDPEPVVSGQENDNDTTQC